MSLTVDEKKELFLGLFDHILEMHSNGVLKEQLVKFLKPHLLRGEKGIVYLHFNEIRDMSISIQGELFPYGWMTKAQAEGLQHSGVKIAMQMMNPRKDCIFVAGIDITNKHKYINCMKIKDIF